MMGRKFVRVCIDRNEIRISTLTEEDLRNENVGYEDFVGSIMKAISQNKIYDDSDPSSNLYVYYCPQENIVVNGEPLVETS